MNNWSQLLWIIVAGYVAGLAFDSAGGMLLGAIVGGIGWIAWKSWRPKI